MTKYRSMIPIDEHLKVKPSQMAWKNLKIGVFHAEFAVNISTGKFQEQLGLF